jgi:transposase
VLQAKRHNDPLSQWVTRIVERSHTNVAAAALANKTVRIAWSMLRNEADYNPALAVA